MQKLKNFCSICGITHLSHTRKMTQMCAGCNENSVDRTEVRIRKTLFELGLIPPPSAQDDTLFGQTCDVVKKRRPDFLWIWKDRVVIGEIDENGGHGTTNYTPECDTGWIMDMTCALVQLFQKNYLNDGKIPHIFVVRMNPDECDVNPQPLQNRIQTFADRINYYCYLENLDGYESRVPNVEYHFYHTKCYNHIRYAIDHPNAIHVVNKDLL